MVTVSCFMVSKIVTDQRRTLGSSPRNTLDLVGIVPAMTWKDEQEVIDKATATKPRQDACRM